MEYLLTLLGFGLLIVSGKYLVKGSVSLAQFFKVSTLVIGVTVVALGTSAPELLVSIQAALKDHPEMSIGNVVGSNISNIALVLAITSIILPISVHRNSIRIDWPVMMAISILFYVFVRDNRLDRYEGIIFNILLIGFVFFSVRYSRKEMKNAEIVPAKAELSILTSIVLILLSSLGLVIGSNLLVENAAIIATDLGISERAISISMIAIGTSIPELVTSVMAAVQKETDISVGNIVGSNIFNLLSVLGITAIIKPIFVSDIMVNFDIIWMLGISLLLFLLIFPLKSARLGRTQGIVLLLVYVTYLYLVFKAG